MTISKRFFQNKTKFITSYFKGVPKLKNEYGSLNNLLTHVLTLPYNKTEISGIEELPEILRLIAPLNHGFNPEQVIRILDHPNEGLNREFRIISTTAESIDIIKPSEIVIAAGNIQPFNIEAMPLGYSVVYEDLDKGIVCFKNKSLKSPGILKVIDQIPPNGYLETWSKFARVVAGSSINSVGDFKDNFKTPFHPNYPDAEKTGDGKEGAVGTHGFAKWTYSLSSSTAPKETDKPIDMPLLDWIIIGDDRSFYLMIKTTGVADNSNYSYDLVGFGNFYSYNEKETFNICLQAKDGFMAANTTTDLSPTRPRSYFGALDYNYSGFILTDAYGSHETDYGRVKSYGNFISTNNLNVPWDSSYIKTVIPGAYIYDRLLIKDFYNFIRGHYRGVSILYGNSLPDKYILQNKISIQVQQPITTTALTKASMLFDLTDWEEIL